MYDLSDIVCITGPMFLYTQQQQRDQIQFPMPVSLLTFAQLNVPSFTFTSAIIIIIIIMVLVGMYIPVRILILTSNSFQDNFVSHKKLISVVIRQYVTVTVNFVLLRFH